MTHQSRPQCIQNNHVNLLVKTEESPNSSNDKFDFRNFSKSFEGSSKIKSDFCDCKNTNKTESDGQNLSEFRKKLFEIDPKTQSQNQNKDSRCNPNAHSTIPSPLAKTPVLKSSVKEFQSISDSVKIKRSHIQKDIIKILKNSLSYNTSQKALKNVSRSFDFCGNNNVRKYLNKSIQTERKSDDDEFVLLEKILEKDNEIK